MDKKSKEIVILNCTNQKSGSIMPIKSALINNSLQSCTLKFRTFFHGPPIKVNVVLEMGTYSIIVWTNGKSSKTSFSEGLRWKSIEVNIGKRVIPFKVVIEGVCQDPTIMPLIQNNGQNYRARANFQRNSSALLLDALQLADCITSYDDVLPLEDVGTKELQQNKYFTFTKNSVAIPSLKSINKDETITQKNNVCRGSNSSNYFACGMFNKISKNTVQCIPNDKVCDLVPDCPNGEDESSSVCGQMPQGSMCNFEEGWCGWENEEIRDKMQWYHANGFSSKGPKIDHTFANASGHYLHFTGAIKGSRLGHSALLKSQVFHPLSATLNGRDDETKIISPDIYDTFFKKCKIRFWYHMNGPHTGALELWVNHFSSVATDLFRLTSKSDDDNLPYDPRDQGSFHRIWRAFGESEDVWKKVELPLFQPPNLPESFFLEFIAKRGLMEQGDVAIDDISLSKHCFGMADDHLSFMNFSMEDVEKDTSPLAPFINIISMTSKQNFSMPLNQTVFKFDTCQSVGRLGPDLEMCEVSLAKNYETKQNLKTNKILPKTPNEISNITLMSNHTDHHLLLPKLYVTSDEKYAGIQAWKVPRDGYYKFTALGARGGRGALNPYGYGKGAQVTGHLDLKAGEVIFMLIGQEGQDACKSFRHNDKVIQNITEQNKLDPHISKICNDASHSVESSMWDYYERKGYAGGGGGGGGATYIFKFDNTSQTLVPLFVAAGGGGGSVKIANRLTNYQIYPKLDIHGQGFNPESIKQNQEGDQNIDHGDGYSNPKGAGGGGGWESALSMTGHRAQVLSGLTEPSPSTTRAGGSLVTRGGKGGLGASGCGHARGSATLKKDSSSLWKTDGGFGGGGAPCTAGGGGGGWRGGDAPLGNSLYENGAGGRSYAAPLAEKTEGLTGINDKSGLVIIRAVLKDCPCSFKCTTLDPFAGKFQCLCPPESVLARDGKTCRGKSWFRGRPPISTISPKHLAFVILFAILFTISLSSCLIYLIMNQPKFRKKFLNRSPALLSPHGTIDAANSHASYQNGLPTDQIYATGPGSKGGILHYLAQLRREILAARSISPGYIEALNHELQLDELRQMGNTNNSSLKQLSINPGDLQPPPTNESLSWKRFMSLLQPIASDNKSKEDGDRKTSLPMTEKNPFYGKLNLNETGKCCDSFIDTDLLYDYEGSQINEIPRDKLKLVKALGEGAFGEVYQGLLLVDDKNAKYCQGSDKGRSEIPVAVKTLPENCKEIAEMDFFMEAFIMSKFHHKNIVKFYGTCLNNHPRFIVLEYLAGGDLKNYLREIRSNYPQSRVGITFKELLELALDIANGCRYLEENHFVHRDIAARNCLLTSKLAPNRVAKIADFGMSRDVYRADYYRKGGKAMLPVKWMPPEAFLDGLFTTKTDVWSFGVLLWEVFSLGYMPYPGCGNQEVMVKVSKGQRLDCPPRCPKTIYALMNECWHADPNQRPKFAKIVEVLKKFLTDPVILKAKPIPSGTDHHTLNTAFVTQEREQTLDSDNDHPAQSPFIKSHGKNNPHAQGINMGECPLTSPKNSQSTSGRGESLTCSCEVSDCSSQQTLNVRTFAPSSNAPRLSDSLYSQCSSYDYLIPLNAPSSTNGCTDEPNKHRRDLLAGEEIPVFHEVEGDSNTTQIDHAYENANFNVCYHEPKASRQIIPKNPPHKARSQSSINVVTVRDKSAPCQALSCFDIRKILGTGQQTVFKDPHQPLNFPIKIAPINESSRNPETKYAVRRLDSNDTTNNNDAMRDSGIEDTTATLSSCCASSIADSPNLTPKDIKFPTSIDLGFQNL